VLAGQTHVEDEQRVLGAHDLRRTVGRDLCALFVPPKVTAFGHWDLVTGSLKNENLLDSRALLERGVDD
jgi:hypothetical protein